MREIHTVLNRQLLHYAATRELSDCVEVVAVLLDSGASASINKIMFEDNLEGYLMSMYTRIGTPLQLARGRTPGFDKILGNEWCRSFG